MTLAQMNVCDQLSAFQAHDKEALYATFPRSPAAFSNVLQLEFWLLRLSEMNQANFVGESMNEPNSVYNKIIQNNKLVVFLTIPCNHVLVARDAICGTEVYKTLGMDVTLSRSTTTFLPVLSSHLCAFI